MKRCAVSLFREEGKPTFELMLYGIDDDDFWSDQEGSCRALNGLLAKRGMSLEHFSHFEVKPPSRMPRTGVPRVYSTRKT